MGMKEYLTYIRLKHAAMELLSTNHTITDVALNSGFSNSNYFKDAFKKTYNVSPREYRASRKTDVKLETALKEGK
jgi:AraC-like DNA-binding protein